MARQVITTFVDDLDGSPAEGTVDFSFDGKSYQIDLNAGNKERLEKALEEFVAGARRATGGRNAVRAQPVKRDRERSAAVRDWARQNGYTVSDRGRVSKQIEAAYDAAH